MGTYILGGSNTNDDTGVLNAQGDVNALSDVIVANDLTVNGSVNGLNVTADSTFTNASLSGTLSVTGDSTLASTTASSLTVSDTLTSPNINASTSPLDLQVAGSTVATLDSSGDLTIDGWSYIKGRNRVYQQNLTASTTTSTSMVQLGSENIIDFKFSGHLVITAELRVSNDTLSDGISVELAYAHSSATTILDTETYTQEGLAGNEHTMVFHYEITGGTIGSGAGLYFNFAAVTGGTASAKIVSFICEEI